MLKILEGRMSPVKGINRKIVSPVLSVAKDPDGVWVQLYMDLIWSMDLCSKNLKVPIKLDRAEQQPKRDSTLI